MHTSMSMCKLTSTRTHSHTHTHMPRVVERSCNDEKWHVDSWTANVLHAHHCTLSVLGSALTLPPSSSQQSRQCLRLLAGVRQYIVCLLRTAVIKIKSEKRKGGGEKTRMEKNMSMEWHKKDQHKYNCTKEPQRLWAKK